MKLSERSIRAIELPDGQLDKIFFDDEMPGFGIRVRASVAELLASTP